MDRAIFHGPKCAHSLSMSSERIAWHNNGELTIALGSDIHSASGASVETIIENRNLPANGTNTLTLDGSPVATDLGDQESVAAPQWAHLDGVAGYVLIVQAPVLHTARGTYRHLVHHQPQRAQRSQIQAVLDSLE